MADGKGQTTTGRTSTEERALALLGSGLGIEIVANAVGVDASRISQLMSDEQFSKAVTELRFKNLQKHNERDSLYDSLEDKALEQLKSNLPLIQRPMELLKTIKVLNEAKRRGQSAPDSIVNQNTVVQLNIPMKIVNKFITNINNQVIKAGEKELITIQSSALDRLSAASAEDVEATESTEKIIRKEINHVSSTKPGSTEASRTNSETANAEE